MTERTITVADGKYSVVLRDPPATASMLRHGEFWQIHPIPNNVELALAQSIADHEDADADHRRLVRTLDVLLNGEMNAAQQASLCDIVSQVEREKLNIVIGPVPRPLTLANCNNDHAWKLGEICRKAADDPNVGDYIDRGLILRRMLEEGGYGLVTLPRAGDKT